MRQSVPLDRCTRLLNHGPTVLVSAEHAGRRNVMAAAWSMPLDFTPPKVAVVLDKQTFTRTLVHDSGHFVLAVPTVALAALTDHVGSVSGRDVEKFSDVLASALRQRRRLAALAAPHRRRPLLRDRQRGQVHADRA